VSLDSRDNAALLTHLLSAKRLSTPPSLPVALILKLAEVTRTSISIIQERTGGRRFEQRG